MADLGHDMTEKELAALERRIKKVYGEASKDLQKKADEYFALFIERDKAQQELLEAGKITGEQYKQWRLAQIGRGKRFEALRDDVAKRMLEANRVAVSYVNDATPGIYSLNHNYAAYTIEQVAGDVGFTLYDEQTVKRLIAEDPTLLPKRRVDAPKDLKWNKKRFGAEITAGILMGEPIAKLADRVENLSDANRSGAIRNARTAVTGAQNAGRQESYHQAKKMGLQLRKRWIATKDMRTRHEHALLDGQTVALDEPFKVDGHKLMFPGDPTGLARLVWNCRCTMRTVEKEGIEAETRQMHIRDPETGRNVLVNEMTYKEWFSYKTQQSDVAGKVIRAVKNATTFQKKVVAFSQLSDKMKSEFRAGLATANPDVKKALRKVYISTDFVTSDKKKSFFKNGIHGGTVTLGKDASASTIAHELFHKMDGNGKISIKLVGSVAQDHIALNVRSGGNIKAYLMNRYPAAFIRNPADDEMIMKPEYRGIADVLHGMSGGAVWYGYGHSKGYWANEGSLEAEAWAQFGRIYYDNNPAVVSMYEDIFPSIAKQAKSELKGLS